LRVYARAERHASSFAFWRPISASSLNRDFVDPHVGFWQILLQKSVASFFGQ
jgi:hypothetical protein